MAAPDPIGVGLVGYGLAGRSFHAPFIAQVEGLRLRRGGHDGSRSAGAGDRRAPRGRRRGRRRCDARSGRHRRGRGGHAEPAPRPDRDQALASGRHVVVDKPMAMDVAEGGAPHRGRRPRRPTAVRLSQPALGRRLPDRSAASSRRARWGPSTASSRASSGSPPSTPAGGSRPPRWAVRSATSVRTSSTRRCSCSGRRVVSGRSSRGAATATRGRRLGLRGHRSRGRRCSHACRCR